MVAGKRKFMLKILAYLAHVLFTAIIAAIVGYIAIAWFIS